MKRYSGSPDLFNKRRKITQNIRIYKFNQLSDQKLFIEVPKNLLISLSNIYRDDPVEYIHLDNSANLELLRSILFQMDYPYAINIRDFKFLILFYKKYQIEYIDKYIKEKLSEVQFNEFRGNIINLLFHIGRPDLVSLLLQSSKYLTISESHILEHHSFTHNKSIVTKNNEKYIFECCAKDIFLKKKGEEIKEKKIRNKIKEEIAEELIEKFSNKIRSDVKKELEQNIYDIFLTDYTSRINKINNDAKYLENAGNQLITIHNTILNNTKLVTKRCLYLEEQNSRLINQLNKMKKNIKKKSITE